MDMYHTYVPNLIGTGNLYIMIMMLCLILVLPVAVRLLTFGKKNKLVMSYMGGANAGDDRNFTDSLRGGKAHVSGKLVSAGLFQ